MEYLSTYIVEEHTLWITYNEQTNNNTMHILQEELLTIGKSFLSFARLQVANIKYNRPVSFPWTSLNCIK